MRHNQRDILAGSVARDTARDVSLLFILVTRVLIAADVAQYILCRSVWCNLRLSTHQQALLFNLLLANLASLSCLTERMFLYRSHHLLYTRIPWQSISAVISLPYFFWISFILRPPSISAGTSTPQLLCSDLVIFRSLSTSFAYLFFFFSRLTRPILFVSPSIYLISSLYFSFPMTAGAHSTFLLKAS